ncbi:MAG: 3-deoxy-8-phosphooctulonate synthase [Acidobacteria bacterium]|nr:3-deoxy-8-phosphooctulonate synthase [Acidobacteriota bacterium]
MVSTRAISLGRWKLGGGHPFFLIAGPCVIESRDHSFKLADYLKRVTSRLGIPFIFKASYDKANRTSIKSYRGPGLDKGLFILQQVREQFEVPVLSDVHSVEQVSAAASVLDVLQIPAFLSRQTDLILAAAESGKLVNVKKGQFLAPWDVCNIVEKVRTVPRSSLLITERGVSFGYNNLVVDFKSLPIIRSLGVPVVFDATHSVQLPGGVGFKSGGQAEFIPYLVRAAAAVGVDGLFLEVHDRPEKALSDGANALPLLDVEPLLRQTRTIDQFVKKTSINGARKLARGKGR